MALPGSSRIANIIIADGLLILALLFEAKPRSR